MDSSKDGKFIDTLISHEGKEKFAYKDSLGYWTIGCGRCVDKEAGIGLTESEMNYLLHNDVERCRVELDRCAFYRKEVNKVRQDALVELSFNMGISRLLKFIKMVSAIEAGDYKLASYELSNSKWAKEVSKERVDNIKYRLENGTYP